MVKKGNLGVLTDNSLDMFWKCDKAGWRWTVPWQALWTAAYSNHINKDGKLPTFDIAGNSIAYKEFDVNKIPNACRDAQRFIIASDRSIYYNDDHYLTF